MGDRPYQEDTIRLTREAFSLRNRRGVIICQPVGTGKTWVASKIIRSAVMKGSRVWFMAHRRELIKQASARLDDEFIAHGIVNGSHSRDIGSNVIVCSVMTVKNRPGLPVPDMIITDECHRAAGPTYRMLFARYPKALLIGLTATPSRLDGRPLDMYDEIVETITTQEAVDQGYLVPFRYITPPSPRELSGLKKTRGGDYDMEEAARILAKADALGDVVKTWKQHASDRLTVVFSPTIEYSKNLVEQFARAGVSRVAHIDATTPLAVRDRVTTDLKSGALQVVSNVDVYTEGWDCPEVSCVILRRPTASYVKAQQMRGRVARICPQTGKKDALIIDHVRIWSTHGLVTDKMEWSLTGRSQPAAPLATTLSALRNCPQCFCLYESRLGCCPACGHEPPKAKTRRQVEADLELREAQSRILSVRNPTGGFGLHVYIDGKEICEAPSGVQRQNVTVIMQGEYAHAKRQKVRIRSDRDFLELLVPKTVPEIEKIQYLSYLIARQVQNGYKLNWVRMIFKSRYGFFPSNDLLDKGTDYAKTQLIPVSNSGMPVPDKIW